MFGLSLRQSIIASGIIGSSMIGKCLYTSIKQISSSKSWPQSKPNTILNICPQGSSMIVERLGAYHKIHKNGGYFFAIPLIDKIKYIINLQEQAMRIEPLKTITADNVSIEMGGNLFLSFIDEYKAAYGAVDPLYSVSQLAQASMRDCIGSMDLDDILSGRNKINEKVLKSLESSKNWGIEVKRYEVTSIQPDKSIMDSMMKQVQAERERRELVLNAEGFKQAAKLKSEGEKIKLMNESEGNLIKVTNEAEAEKKALILKAEGNAEAILKQSQATANSIDIIAKTLNNPNSKDAIIIHLAKEQIEMQGKIGSTSNTIFFSEKPADINNLIMQAKTILNTKI